MELFRKGDMSNWQLDSKDKDNINSFYSDRLASYKKICFKETNTVIKQKEKYGYHLNKLISEYQRLRSINTIEHKEKVIQFSKKESEITSNYVKMMGNIVAIMENCVENTNKEEEIDVGQNSAPPMEINEREDNNIQKNEFEEYPNKNISEDKKEEIRNEIIEEKKEEKIEEIKNEIKEEKENDINNIKKDENGEKKEENGEEKKDNVEVKKEEKEEDKKEGHKKEEEKEEDKKEEEKEEGKINEDKKEDNGNDDKKEEKKEERNEEKKEEE